MLRPKPSTYPLCLSKSNPRYSSLPKTTPWSSQRSVAQAQRQRPSRMTLSPRVAQPAPRTTRAGRPMRSSEPGPFGGLNQKDARITRAPERTLAAKERRSGGRDGGRDGRAPALFHALKMQRTLAPVSYNHRNEIKERIAKVDSFADFPLLPIIQQSIPTQALQGLQTISPTPVQKIAIPALLGDPDPRGRKKLILRTFGAQLQGRDEFLIAAETGSGKTLSYLLPTINAVKLAETAEAKIEAQEKALQEEQLRQNTFSPPLTNMPHPTTGRPRAIILLPTSELVTQVGSLVKSISHAVKFRSALISSAYSGKVIRNRLFSPSGIDILVSTPHLLSSIADSDPNILSRVTHLVIDEADTLLDRGFAPLTSSIIDKATPSLKKLILCSATVPRSLDSYLRKRFPDIRRLVTPNLHAIPRRVQLGVVDVEKDPYRGNKDLACADCIWSIGKAAAENDLSNDNQMDVKRILIFVNEREKTVEVADYLVSKGVDAVALSRDTPEQRQQEILSTFTTTTPITVPKEQHPGSLGDNQSNYIPFNTPQPKLKRKLPNTKVLVVTDLGSRGIDTVAVRHVILYDVPHTTIDFIHRLGRTGRMGRRGRGIVLVGKGDRRDIVAEVKDGMFRGQALI